MTAELVAPAHASYSQLDTFLTCGEKYYLSRVAGYATGTSWALLGGSAVHSHTEELDRALFTEGVGCVTVEEIELRFKEHLAQHLREALERNSITLEDVKASGRASKAWPNKENRDWWEHNGPTMVWSWQNWRDSTPWDVWVAPDGQLAIELVLEVEFGGVKIKLAIDRVMEWNGQLIVVDIKSGREPVSQFQLGMYAHAIAQHYGIKAPMYGAYWLSRTGTATQAFSLSHYTEQIVNATFRKFQIARTMGIYLPHPSNLCGSCGVQDFCSIRGSRAHEVSRSYLEV